ncbi:MAG: M15 family metallopeptidase [Bacilli bacterium]|nr:M15 family metallopeptidase [Bacilli bacterium]
MAVRRKRRVKIRKVNFAIFILAIVLITALVTKTIKIIYTSLTKEKEPVVVEKEKKKSNPKQPSETNSFEEISYYKETNKNRYIRYQENNPNLPLETIVTYVNIGLDNNYYTYTNKAKDLNKTTILVNKYNYLTRDYVPNNLESLPLSYARSGMKLVSVAKDAYVKMAKAAEKEKMKLVATSSYRDYEYQETIYNRYVKSDGKEAADTYSGRPGFSEHQTGLAIDLYNGKKLYTEFESTKEFSWMQDNAYKYGFILRFPKDKENITGYEYESWHYRYVGEDIAKYIHDNDITFEEYYVKFLDK